MKNNTHPDTHGLQIQTFLSPPPQPPVTCCVSFTNTLDTEKRIYRVSLQTPPETALWCVINHSRRLHLTTSVNTSTGKNSNFQEPRQHRRNRGGSGWGRQWHTSSCWAAITFYPIGNLWNNTGSDMSEPLTSPFKNRARQTMRGMASKTSQLFTCDWEEWGKWGWGGVGKYVYPAVCVLEYM